MKACGPLELREKAFARVMVARSGPSHISQLVKVGGREGKVIGRYLRVLRKLKSTVSRHSGNGADGSALGKLRGGGKIAPRVTSEELRDLLFVGLELYPHRFHLISSA
jgi:hypothetical protein